MEYDKVKRWRFFLRRRVPSLGVVAAAMLAICVTQARADASDTCPNAATRIGLSARLPGCRAYELVSPAEKAGGIVAFPAGSQGHSAFQGGLNAASRDGDLVAYWAYQPLADPHTGLPSNYRATRTASGWSSIQWSPGPPASVERPPSLSEKVLVTDATDDLKTGYFESTMAFDPLLSPPIGAINVFSVDDTGSVVRWISRGNESTPASPVNPSAYQGRSADGTHVLFQTPEQLTDAARTQLAGTSLYVRDESTTTLVAAGANELAVSQCGATVGGGGARRGGISPNGSRILFMAPDQFGFGDPSCFVPTQVFLRDGDDVIQISRTQRAVPDTTAASYSPDANADLTEVYFISDEALTDDADVNGFGYLYRYDVASGRLALLTVAGGVTNIVSVPSSGDRVYFTRGTELSVYSGGAVFGIGDVAADNDYFFNRAPLRTTPTGDFLVFASTANQTSFDSQGRVELYRFEARTSETICISCNRTGATPLGGATLWSTLDPIGATITILSRNMTSDGRTIVFDTVDALVPEDTNGYTDVYEWREGVVSLISDGVQPYGSFFFDMNNDGSSIFFATAASLVAADTDEGRQDIYVARTGGGFPEPVLKAQCNDQCQGTGSGPPTLSDTDIMTDFEPVSPLPGPPRAAGRTVTIAAPTRNAKARFARTGVISLSVRVGIGGSVRIAAVGRAGTRSHVLARVVRRVAKPGTLTVRLSLKRAAQWLTRKRAVPVVVTVTLVGGDSKTVRLRLDRSRA